MTKRARTWDTLAGGRTEANLDSLRRARGDNEGGKPAPYDVFDLETEVFVLDCLDNVPTDPVAQRILLEPDIAVQGELAAVIGAMQDFPGREYDTSDYLVILDALEEGTYDLRELLPETWYRYVLA